MPSLCCLLASRAHAPHPRPPHPTQGGRNITCPLDYVCHDFAPCVKRAPCPGAPPRCQARGAAPQPRAALALASCHAAACPALPLGRPPTHPPRLTRDTSRPSRLP